MNATKNHHFARAVSRSASRNGMIGLSAMSFHTRNANSNAMKIRIFERSQIAIFLRVCFTSTAGTGTWTGGGGGGGAATDRARRCSCQLFFLICHESTTASISLRCCR